MAVKVLVIEDNPADYRLIHEKAAAVAEGYFQLFRVGSLADALALLSRQDFELILLDLNLPDSRGLDTFTRLQQAADWVPVVVISGLEDAELAIRAVQSGAQDYIAKDRFHPDSLARAMRYAVERKRLELQVKEAERRYRTIFEDASDMILVGDQQGHILDANASACRMLGYSSQAIRQKTIAELLPAEVVERLYPKQASNQLHLPEEPFEVVCAAAGGDHFPAEVRLRHEEINGQLFYLVMLRDIRHFKRVEEAYQVLVDHSLQELLIVQDGKIVFANPAAVRSSGYSLQEIYDLSTADLWGIIHPDDRALVQLRMDSALEQQQVQPVFQYRVLRKDRQERWIEVLIAPVEYNGHPALQLSLVDITERRRAEQRMSHRLAIESLVTAISIHFISVPHEKIEAEIEHALQSLGEFSSADRCYLYLFGEDGAVLERVYEWSRSGLVLPLAGLKGFSMSGFHWAMARLRQGDTVHVTSLDDLPAEAAAEKAAWQEWGIQSLLFIPLILDNRLHGLLGFNAETGQKSWAAEDFHLLRMMGGVFVNVLARWQAEESLLQAQQNQGRLMASITDSLWTGEINTQGKVKVLYVSPVIEKITGYPVEYFLQDVDFGLRIVCPEDYARVKSAFEQLNTGQISSLEIEYRIRRPDGALCWLRDSETVTREPDGRLLVNSVLSDVTDRKQAEENLQQANRKLQETVAQLEQRNREAALLNELGDLLQGCLNAPEVYSVVMAIASRLFPDHDGALLIHNPSRRYVEMVTQWGERVDTDLVFESEKCWGLRRGRLHSAVGTSSEQGALGERRAEGVPAALDVGLGSSARYLSAGLSTPLPAEGELHWQEGGRAVSSELVCRHVHAAGLVSHTCVPLAAQGEMIGLLYLQAHQPVEAGEQLGRLATIASERVAMALANLRLRESLQIQSIHDSLTGLFNRKYMEETTLREIRRAARQKHSIGLIMLDIDRFKQFNDRYGHGAGDGLLTALGNYLRNKIRGSDIACRYGGDEFVLVFPEASLKDTLKRAEELRQGAKLLEVTYRDVKLGILSLSIGVSCYPEHGSTLETLVRKADMALYRSKNAGGDQVSVAE